MHTVKNTAGKTPHDLLSAANQVRDWDVRLEPKIFELAGGDDRDVTQVMQNAKNKNEEEVVEAAPLNQGNQAAVVELPRHNVDLTKSMKSGKLIFDDPLTHLPRSAHALALSCTRYLYTHALAIVARILTRHFDRVHCYLLLHPCTHTSSRHDFIR